MQLQARDKRALMGGSAAAVVLLAFLLWPRGDADSNVQLVPAAERGAPTPATVTPAPQPVAQPAATPPAVAVQPGAPGQPAAAQGGVPEGLKLTGVTATGAIFAFADGSQRLVYRGREVAPGLVLQTVRVREVLLSANGAPLRLTFSGPAAPIQPAASAAVPSPPPAPAAQAAPATPSPPLDRSLFR